MNDAARARKPGRVRDLQDSPGVPGETRHVPDGSVFGSVRFGSIRFRSVRFGSVRFHSAA